MFRLIGFVFGSAISIGAILLILGIPRFHLSNPNLDKARFDEAVEKLKEKTRDVEVIARDIAEKAVEAVEAPASVADTEVQEDIADAQETVAEEAPVDTAPLFELPADVLPAAFETQWHPFWNSFRSEIAATGFVSQLEKVTGLDYRVVKVKIGVYQVAFAYGSDDERRLRLSQISAATGLELPES